MFLGVMFNVALKNVGGDTDVLNSEKFLPVKPVIYIVKNQSGT
jgi:hypothetical protein